MENNKNPHGGARPNAGRKKIEGRIRTALIIGQETNVLLTKNAKKLNTSRNKLADKILLNYLKETEHEF